MIAGSFWPGESWAEITSSADAQGGGGRTTWYWLATEREKKKCEKCETWKAAIDPYWNNAD